MFYGSHRWILLSDTHISYNTQTLILPMQTQTKISYWLLVKRDRVVLDTSEMCSYSLSTNVLRWKKNVERILIDATVYQTKILYSWKTKAWYESKAKFTKQWQNNNSSVQWLGPESAVGLIEIIVFVFRCHCLALCHNSLLNNMTRYITTQ